MNNMYERGVCDRYILFSIVFSMLGFVLAAIKQSNKKTSLEEIIEKYNISKKDDKILYLRLDKHYNNILESYFKGVSRKEYKKNKKQLKKYERIRLDILCGKINNKTFQGIIKKIKPTELNISSWNLDNKSIRGIKLNKNIEVFRLAYSRVTNTDKLFRNKNKKLKEINISNNILKTFPDGLWRVLCLEKLDISGNFNIFEDWSKLSDKDIRKYKPLENATTLNMSYTNLDSIEEKKLSSFLRLFPNLRVLKMQQYYNIGLKTILISLKSLRRLDISYNYDLKNIKHTENNLEPFRRLEELNVLGCIKLRIGNEFLKKLESVKYLNIYGVPLEDIYTEDSNFHETLKFLSLKKLPPINFLDKGNMDFSLFKDLFKGLPGNGYSRIYGLKRLRVLCIKKDKIHYPNLLREDIETAYDQNSYIKLVEKDREKEWISLVRTWVKYLIRSNKHIS